MQIHLQYLTDSAGAKTAVQIPFKEWKMLADDYKHLQEYGSVKTQLTDAFKDVSAIEEGKKTAVTLKEFLHDA